MSKIVTTQFGRFRQVADGDRTWFLWECPRCKGWGSLSEAQANGTVSVQCGGDGASSCDYHETHRFGAELVAVMEARILTGDSPIDPESESWAAQ